MLKKGLVLHASPPLFTQSTATESFGGEINEDDGEASTTDWMDGLLEQLTSDTAMPDFLALLSPEHLSSSSDQI